MKPRVLRSSQLDANELDKELDNIFREQILDMFSFFKTSFKSKYEPEINTVLDLIVIGGSVLSTSTTYGLKLQNLVYKKSSNNDQHLYLPLSQLQKWLFIGFRISFIWGWTRLQKYFISKGWSNESQSSWKFKVWRWIQRIEITYQSLNLINLLIFLHQGKYRNLMDRILGIRLVFDQVDMSRMISFEYMNRQLVWHAFTEFFVSILPFLNFKKFKSNLKLYFKSKQSISELPSHLCLICFQNNNVSSEISIPYETNCGHSFCYYCLQSNMMANRSFVCPRCGDHVVSIDPVGL